MKDDNERKPLAGGRTRRTFTFKKPDRELLERIIRENCYDCMCWDLDRQKCSRGQECAVERCLKIVGGLGRHFGCGR